MKNIIITLLVTYIFWFDICTFRPWPVLPLVVLVVYINIVAIEEEVMEHLHSKKRGQRLARKIKRLER